MDLEAQRALMIEIGEVERLERGKKRITWSDVAERSGLSGSYVTHLASGRTPMSERGAKGLAKAYPDFAIRLFDMAGEDLPITFAEQIPRPRSAAYLSDAGKPIPFGPPVSAGSFLGDGEQYHGESIDLNSLLKKGAHYVLRVSGDCLAPAIQDGDYVGIKTATRAENGAVVVAQIVDGSAEGELGDGFTLKIWRTDGKKGPGFYTAKNVAVALQGQARIVGRAVAHVSRRPLTFG